MEQFKFFYKYKDDYISISNYGNDKMWNRFDELISANKHYFSYFKRAVDFRKFDREFFDKTKTELQYIKNNIPNINKVKQLDEILAGDYKEYIEKYKYFFINYCIDSLYELEVLKETLFFNIEKGLNEKDLSETHIQNCILRSCAFNFGYNTAKTPVFFYDPNNEPIRIEQMSTQLKSFKMKRALSPLFHLYFLPECDTKNYIICEIDEQKFSKIFLGTVFNEIWKK